MKRALVLLALYAPGAAFADESPAKVQVTSFLLAHPGVDDAQCIGVVRAIDDGLKRNTRLEMKDLETRLAEFAQEVPQEQIDAGRTLFAEGQKALTALELPVAAKKLTQAVEALSKVLPYIKKQELADAMMALAAAYFENGDKKSAMRELARLYTWRSDYRLDTNRFPPDLIAPAEDARKEVEKAKRGSLEIQSDPPAAQAFVDGRDVGVTPTFAEGLAVGEHFITLKRQGYRKAVTSGTVSAKQQQVVRVTLERSGKYLLVEQALQGVESSVGAATIDAAVDTLKEILFVDHVVFVKVKTGTAADRLDVTAFLYDVRNRRRVSKVHKVVAVVDAERDLSQTAQALYLNASYEVAEEVPRDAPIPKKRTRTPFYKAWWFWTAAAVVVGGVVAAAIAVPRPVVCGDGNACRQLQF